MKNQIKLKTLSADMQAYIEPPPIPFSKTEVNEDSHINTTKVKILCNIASYMSETYKPKMNIFENGQ